MDELQSLFSEQPEAQTSDATEAEQTATETEAGPPTDSQEQLNGDDNTGETNSTSETEDAETSSPDPDQGDETKPSLEQVKIALDDSEFEVELPSEIAEKVKNGVMMQHQFTKNQQALAEQRKDFEAESAKVLQKQQEALNELAAQLMFEQSQLDTPEMKQLKEFDRPEFDRRKAEYDDRYQVYQQFMQERGEALKAEQAKQAEQYKAALAQEHENLKVMIPDWLDDTKRAEEQKQIIEYAQGIGFKTEELNINRANLMRVFRDAMKYNQAQTNIQAKKSKPAVTSVKAGSKPQPVSEKPLHSYFYDS